MPGDNVEYLMQQYRAYKSAPKIPQAPPPIPDMDQPVAPETPTMTSASTIPPEQQWRKVPWIPPELAEDISARPLVSPDFVMDIKRYLVNPNLWPRWIFTDKRRYQQALSQGWRPAKSSDFKASFAQLSPYSEEGGTKYINGDLILMLIDRKLYLGALRRKHDLAASFTDIAMAKRIAAQKAQAAMGQEVNAINSWMERQGRRPVMEVFDPYNESADLTAGADPATTAAVSRMESARDTGRLADLTKE